MNKIGRNERCWCGSEIKYKQCHSDMDETLKDFRANGFHIPPRRLIKSASQIQKIRESGVINTLILNEVAARIQAGMTTEEINVIVNEKTAQMGGRPAQLHFHGFPKSVCTSINNQVCHGIPSENTVLQDGDIINVDVSTEYDGYYSDSSRMFCIGHVSDEKKRLVDVARECRDKGVEQIQPWHCMGNMGHAIGEHARANGYSIVRDAGGHGIGLAFHEDPWIGYAAKKDTGMLMVPGMVFTVEPMVNEGGHRVFTDASDGWTIYTEDGKPSAQWESMILVTETGYEILAY